MIYDIDLIISYLQNKRGSEEEWQPEPLHLYDYEEEYYNDAQDKKEEQKRVIIIDI